MWTLIVFILLFDRSSQLAVPGFKDNASCKAAADFYSDTLTTRDPDHRLTFSAVCVPMSKDPAP